MPGPFASCRSSSMVCRRRWKSEVRSILRGPFSTSSTVNGVPRASGSSRIHATPPPAPSGSSIRGRRRTGALVSGASSWRARMATKRTATWRRSNGCAASGSRSAPVSSCARGSPRSRPTSSAGRRSGTTSTTIPTVSSSRSTALQNGAPSAQPHDRCGGRWPTSFRPRDARPSLRTS